MSGTPAPLPLQVRPIAVAGTITLFALFLSLTAHIAARNVLGDVSLRKALLVGPGPAILGALPQAVGVPVYLAVPAAILVDGGLIKYVYGRDRRTTAYITFIHVVVTIILGTVLGSLLILFQTKPAGA